MRITSLVAAAVLTATAFTSFTATPAMAHHGEATCHGGDDVWLGPVAGVDNPTSGDSQGAIVCVYVGGSTYLVGLYNDTSDYPHKCLTAYYAVGGVFLGCFL